MAETSTTVQTSFPPVKKIFFKERYALNIKGACRRSSLLIIYAMSYFVIKSFHETTGEKINKKKVIRVFSGLRD